MGATRVASNLYKKQRANEYESERRSFLERGRALNHTLKKNLVGGKKMKQSAPEYQIRKTAGF